SLIVAAASGHVPLHPPNSPLIVAVAATCSAQPGILDAFLPDFTLLQGMPAKSGRLAVCVASHGHLPVRRKSP
ncbi:MAG: hypothetical protein Q7S71_03600, partial [Candidatus Nitrotoga sp.]|nr:hypothetical protein [Candidatus Nitrotoga sp.]